MRNDLETMVEAVGGKRRREGRSAESNARESSAAARNPLKREPPACGMDPAVLELLARDELRHWWFLARRRILLDLIGELVPRGRENIVVDVGCATGGNTTAISQHYRCIGIDPSSRAVELARRRFPDVEFILGSAPEDLGWMATQARLFLLADVLEHVRDDSRMLSRMVAAAVPGAHFLITVPADPGLWSPHDEAHGHYRRYTRQAFEQLWRGERVSTRLVSHFNCRLLPVIRALRRITCRRGRAFGEAGTDLRPLFPLANRALEWIFAGERARLRGALHGGKGYARGVSLMAVLTRD